jgi:Zn/Cd-binding protein ZinT
VWRGDWQSALVFLSSVALYASLASVKKVEHAQSDEAAKALAKIEQHLKETDRKVSDFRDVLTLSGALK